MDLQNRKPEISYPNKWEYKIIGSDVDEMINAVEIIVKDFEYELVPSNISKKGNYFSMNVIVLVPTEEFRDKIFKELTEHRAISFVI